jgi:hypothetical protein
MTPYHQHSWIHEERNADSARVLSSGAFARLIWNRGVDRVSV